MTVFDGRGALSGLLVVGGVLLGGYGIEQSWVALGSEAADRARLAGGLLHAASAAVITAAALRMRNGVAGPLETPGRFLRSLAGGVLAILLGFGLLSSVHSAAFVCRGSAALWLALLLSEVLWPRSWRRFATRALSPRSRRAIEVAVGNFVAFIVLTELALRAASLAGFFDPFLYDRAQGLRMRPGVHPNGLRINSLGFPGGEFRTERSPGIVRVAALGDSFSVGAVPYEDNYVLRVERSLPGVEVLNFGIAGTGPREYWQVLDSLVWKYDPDLVVVPIFVGNDVIDWITPASLLRLDPDGLRSAVVARRLMRVIRERRRLEEERRSAPAPPSPAPLASPWSEATHVEVAASELRSCRVEEGAGERENWARVFGYLDRMVEQCRAHRRPIAILLLPADVQVDAELRRRALARLGWRAEEVDPAHPGRRLAEYCRDRRIACLDLLSSFAAAGSAAYIERDCHWNRRGNEIAAEAVASWLAQRFPSIVSQVH